MRVNSSCSPAAVQLHIREWQWGVLPIQTRVPLKFGPETLTEVTCLRVRVVVENGLGQVAEGWGETPLSVQWVWPSPLPYQDRLRSILKFAAEVAAALDRWPEPGHAFELGATWLEHGLPQWLERFNSRGDGPALPYLAALLVLSAFDIAVHDAQGRVLGCDTYATYRRDCLNRPLSDFFGEGWPTAERRIYLDEFLVVEPPRVLPVWHLVGAVDPLTPDELTDQHPRDGYPVLLSDWIRTDGLRCLKIKLRGNDATWDYERLVRVAEIGLPLGVQHLSADFNCTVLDPAYVSEILDRLERDQPAAWAALAYVEQPFPYELEQLRIDVRALAQRKPLYLDESAHDWRHVRLGHELGWNGVALKTCKTQTGALLSLCWARAHGMGIMVQDLTNPRLAQIPHVRLAAHAGTAWGVESNGMQYYPAASELEAEIHPGLYQRRGGVLRLDSLADATGQIVGFGYRGAEACRPLGEQLTSP